MRNFTNRLITRNQNMDLELTPWAPRAPGGCMYEKTWAEQAVDEFLKAREFDMVRMQPKRSFHFYGDICRVGRVFNWLVRCCYIH